MKSTILLLFAALLCFTACDNSSETYIATADSVTLAHNISSLNSPSRKFIHTADVRCRVNNVYVATSRLEDMVRSLDGIVADSRIENEPGNTETLEYKPDSQKIVKTYTGKAHLTLRVPAIFLDTVMKQIPALSSFINARSIKQEDVTLAYLSNTMKNEADGVAPPVVAGKTADNDNNLVKNPKQTKIKPGKEDEVTDRRINNLQLLDDVNYATLRVELYQPAMTDVQVLADPAYAARTPFSTELAIALSKGWQFIKALLVMLVQIWPIWLLAIIGYSIYKTTRRRKIIIRN